MAFEFCWEHRKCTRECRVRDMQVLFCWHLARHEGFGTPGECENCSYRLRWVTGELTTQDFVARFERRAAPRHERRILVVDDEPNILFALEETVRDKGFACVSACDGEEGLIIARGIRPDLIITDVIMPKLNGYELCERLKADPGTRHIPVVMVTVKAGVKDHELGEHAGADAYLVKPFQAQDLARTIELLIPPRA
jgi:twitching motility two-component system response regulator PilH